MDITVNLIRVGHELPREQIHRKPVSMMVLATAQISSEPCPWILYMTKDNHDYLVYSLSGSPFTSYNIKQSTQQVLQSKSLTSNGKTINNA
jgi:hypothetical protein